MGPKVLKFAVALAIFAAPTLALAAPAQAVSPSDMVTWVNNLRAGVHVPNLTVDSTLTSVAQQWADQMASTGVLTHNPNLSVQAPSGWTKIGENIGDDYSLAAAYNALVASPDHYANMVDPAYNRTGIGVATDSSGQVWVVEDLGNWPPPVPAKMVFPASGDRIFPSSQSFSWQQVPGATYYCLTVGTTQGGTDVYNTGALPPSQLSAVVPALPGSVTLWARIYTYNQGAWNWADVSFSTTAATTSTPPSTTTASLTRPTNGATNVDTTQPFTWTPISGASYYGLTIGTSLGAYDLANSGAVGPNQTSFNVPALPTGRTLWARVYTYSAGSWHISDSTFTAAAR